MGNSPKRRKYRDNPYNINYNESNNTYIVVFNFNSKEEKVNISKEVYDVFNRSELIDIKQMNERDRHYDNNEMTDEFIYRNSVVKNETVEDIVEKKIMSENLQKAISKLSDTQRRRIIKYYFQEKSIGEIAKEEGKNKATIKENLDLAIQKLAKSLKN